MKKKRKISIAWFLFFGVLSYLLSDQWEMITAVLSGVMIAWWVTSRIKIKLLYVCWIVFPILSIIYINPVGNKAVEWCEENNPSVMISSTVDYFKEISDEKPSEEIHSLVDKFSEVADSAKDKIKAGFQKSSSFCKNLLKRRFIKPAPRG